MLDGPDRDPVKLLADPDRGLYGFRSPPDSGTVTS
jgi:hypothetical protein